jgi:hypothetical protein
MASEGGRDAGWRRRSSSSATDGATLEQPIWLDTEVAVGRYLGDWIDRPTVFHRSSVQLDAWPR